MSDHPRQKLAGRLGSLQGPHLDQELTLYLHSEQIENHNRDSCYDRDSHLDKERPLFECLLVGWATRSEMHTATPAVGMTS